MSEQRKTPRFAVDIAVAVTLAEGVYVGRLRNLSMGGALMWAPEIQGLSVGSLVEVSFRVPDLEGPLSARAQVRWVSDGDQQTVGIQFVTGFRARETWALGRLLDRLRALD